MQSTQGVLRATLKAEQWGQREGQQLRHRGDVCTGKWRGQDNFQIRGFTHQIVHADILQNWEYRRKRRRRGEDEELFLGG